MSQDLTHRMRIAPGIWVAMKSRRACIVQVLDLETVVVRDTDTGETWHAKIADLRPEGAPPEAPTAMTCTELTAIADKDRDRLVEP